MLPSLAHSSIWNIAYKCNPFFTGRNDVLTCPHDSLKVEKTAAITLPRGISGLGDIGKTQTTLEFAYRYRNDYQANVWVRADIYGTLVSEFVMTAHLLHLSEKDEQDQRLAGEAVKRWLKDHTHWLLVLDNADDLEIVSNFGL